MSANTLIEGPAVQPPLTQEFAAPPAVARTPAGQAPVPQDRGPATVRSHRRQGQGLLTFVGLVFVLLSLAAVVAWLSLEKLKASARPQVASPAQELPPRTGRKFDDLFRVSHEDVAAHSPAVAASAPSAAAAVPAITTVESAEPIAILPSRPSPAPTRMAGTPGTMRASTEPMLERIPARSVERSVPQPGPYDSGFTVSGGSAPGQVAQNARSAVADAGTGIASAFRGSGEAETQQTPLGAMLTSTSTPAAKARRIGNMDMVASEGSTIDCVLRTRIVASLPGMVICKTSTPLYSANGRVVLADRGSIVTGEQGGAMKQGQMRLFVLWRRILTPEGISIRLDSPAADSLGASGVDGDVDNHWPQRIGAAFLLSMVSDAIAYQTARDANGSSASAGPYQNITQSGKSFAEKVLDSTINIPPTLTRSQGDRITIIVARDLDFSTVYELRSR